MSYRTEITTEHVQRLSHLYTCIYLIRAKGSSEFWSSLCHCRLSWYPLDVPLPIYVSVDIACHPIWPKASDWLQVENLWKSSLEPLDAMKWILKKGSLVVHFQICLLTLFFHKWQLHSYTVKHLWWATTGFLEPIFKNILTNKNLSFLLVVQIKYLVDIKWETISMYNYFYWPLK